MQPTLVQLIIYFLRLGTIGFGGPIALCAQMKVDLIDKRNWFTREDYEEGFAFGQTAPGPIAPQLAMYLGFTRFGVLGATLVGIAFILTPFILVLLLSYLYVHHGGLTWIQSVLLAVSPAVVAIVVHATFQLGKGILQNWENWFVAILSFTVAGVFHVDLSIIIIGAGILGLLHAIRPIHPALWCGGITTFFLMQASIQTELASTRSFLPHLAWFFFKAGALTFGSGYVVVAFLQQGVVDEYQWLTVRQFLDGVAIGQITPGPVIITSTFVGYLVEGVPGAIVSTISVLLPVYLITILGAPFVKKYRSNSLLRGFMLNANAAAMGAIAQVAVKMTVNAVIDWRTGVIMGLSLVVLFLRNTPSAVVILIAGTIGVLVF